MKKLIIYSLAITLASCNSKQPSATADTKKETVAETAVTQKPADASTQLTATFKNQPLNMAGKIMQTCTTNNECNSSVIVKQKNTDGNNMYELVMELPNKIETGTFALTKNYLGTFIDDVNQITKGEGENKYTTPTTYKQKSGSITLTSITDKVVSGSFTFNVYKLSDTSITETIQGTIKDLPIKSLGE